MSVHRGGTWPGPAGGGVPWPGGGGGVPWPGGGGGGVPGQKECLLCSGRYASCVHAGGLSCCNRNSHSYTVEQLTNL